MQTILDAILAAPVYAMMLALVVIAAAAGVAHESSRHRRTTRDWESFCAAEDAGALAADATARAAVMADIRARAEARVASRRARKD